MNEAEHLSLPARGLLDRRNFMKNTGLAFGALGLAQLLASEKPHETVA